MKKVEMEEKSKKLTFTVEDSASHMENWNGSAELSQMERQ